MIENVYKLLFVPFPLPVKLRSNTSARLHVDFVDQAVLELVNSGRMRMVNEEPLVVNLLSVSIQPRGKKRLILDLRDVNNSYLSKVLSTRTGKLLWLILRKTRTCFHGGSLIPSNKYFMFNFHCAPARSFLCLLFFHKGFETFRKYWRIQGVCIAIFLDDDWAIVQDRKSCRGVLYKAGFVINREKSVWEPTQLLDWLGITWNFCTGYFKNCRNKNC